jgi:hypothetical protein
MKSLLATLLFLLSAPAVGATNGYELKMNLSFEGKLVSSPQMIVKAGEQATITQKSGAEESFIEVIAKEGEIQGHKGILMNLVVGVIGQDGRRTIKAQPQILAKENEKAVVTVNQGQVGEVSLSVIATRKTL